MKLTLPMFAHGIPESTLFAGLIVIFYGVLPLAVAASMAVVGKHLGRRYTERWLRLFQFLTFTVIAVAGITCVFATATGGFNDLPKATRWIATSLPPAILFIGELRIWRWLQPRPSTEVPQ